MSWKGFAKAVTRLPTRLAQRTGYATETIDDEYQVLEQEFKHVQALATRLTDEAKKIKDSMSAMLAHQAQFSQTLLEAYRPIGAGSAGAGGFGSGGEEEDHKSAYSRGTSGKQEDHHPKSLEAAEAFANAMRSAREQLLPDLEVIERQVVAPTNDYIVLLANVRRWMEKRNRKLVDYDRHRDSVQKLNAKQDRNINDEKKLGSLETSLDQATREYNHVNNLLKQQLPILLSYRTAFIDPCFQTLYWYQLKVTQVLHECFSTLCQQYFNERAPPLQVFESKYPQMIEMLASLTLNKRPLKTTQDGEDAESGYGGSPTHLGPAPTGQGESLPPYEATAVSAAPIGAYPNPFAAAGPSSGIEKPKALYVIALYDFDGVEEEDLSFKKDDKIEVLTRTSNADDWWTGRCNGRTGQFPGNYVQEL
ncbi:hypothetical protein HDU85_007030 [Gaertneriomyces sp. JEL0708]|nr:hypothetical protein HDU85_007030 [Gaertneriomyces sp. JEL0708]